MNREEDAYEIAQEIRMLIADRWAWVISNPMEMRDTSPTARAFVLTLRYIYHRLGAIMPGTRASNNEEHLSEIQTSFCWPKTTVDTMDMIAKRAGVSRSQLIRGAVDDFLARNKDVIVGLRSTSEAEAEFISDIRGIGI